MPTQQPSPPPQQRPIDPPVRPGQVPDPQREHRRQSTPQHDVPGGPTIMPDETGKRPGEEPGGDRF